MPALSIPILALIAGLCGLIWGADRFVSGSVGIARSLGDFLASHWFNGRFNRHFGT